jgi:Rap guanine nucleotide exchange factor 2
LHVVNDEAKLHEMSLECEPASGSGSSGPGSQRGKRHASPAPSTTSSTSSTSDERKPTAKFGEWSRRRVSVGSSGCVAGSASPQAVRKLLALSEPNKTRPHQPRQLPSHGMNTSQASPAVRRAPSATGSYSSYGSHSSSSSGAGGRAMHERSHSDTPTPLPSVALSAESSSVTSLSNLPLRKTVTSGSVTSSDSGHSTMSHCTTSSGEGTLGLSHPYQPRCPSPPRHPPPLPDDEETQVSAV